MFILVLLAFLPPDVEDLRRGVIHWRLSRCIVILTGILSLAAAQTTACGSNFTQASGSFESPGYPSYNSNLDCVYVIKGQIGERITLTFEQFDIQDLNGSCIRDFLEIRDGDSAGSNYIWIPCTAPRTGVQKRSFQNTMYTRFYADGSQPRIRFRFSYTAAIVKDAFLLIPATDTTNAGDILRVDTETASAISIPSLNLQAPNAVEFDPIEGRMYWTDTGFGAISSAYLNGSDQRTVMILSKNTFVLGIAVDPVSRLVFYTDEKNGVVGMMTMSGSSHRTVIQSTGSNRPRAIVLDTFNGVMFWSEWNGTPAKIKRANYDGTDRWVIVSLGLRSPNALALDVSNDLIYWVDGNTEKVECSDLLGNTRRTLFDMPIGSVLFGLAYYDQQLFVINLNITSGSALETSHVWRLGTDQSSSEIMFSVRLRMNDIHVDIQDDGHRGSNGCGDNNGGCSHFCIPLPGNAFKCMCPDSPTNCVDAVNTTIVPEMPGGESAVGVIVGAVVGAVGGCGVIIIVVVVIWRIRKTSKRSTQAAREMRAEAHHGPQCAVNSPDVHWNRSRLNHPVDVAEAANIGSSSTYDEILSWERGENKTNECLTPTGIINDQTNSGSANSCIQPSEFADPKPHGAHDSMYLQPVPSTGDRISTIYDPHTR